MNNFEEEDLKQFDLSLKKKKKKKNIENTYNICEKDEKDEKDENERFPFTVEVEKEKQRRNRIKEVFQQKGGIRIGLFTHRINCPPSFYLISSYEEDKKYFSRSESTLYDGEECSLYYTIRYDISHDTYYVLSGMSDWTDEIFKEIVAPPCPAVIDEIDCLRHVREYLEGEDLDAIFSELHNNRQKAEEKYGLSRFEVDAILNNQL